MHGNNKENICKKKVKERNYSCMSIKCNSAIEERASCKIQDTNYQMEDRSPMRAIKSKANF